MRNCIINLGGIEYIPIRALPLVTKNNLSPVGIVKILSGDEPLLLLDSFVLENGIVKKMNLDEWKGLTNPNKFSELPAKVMVDFSHLKHIWEVIYTRPFPSEEDMNYSYPATGILVSDEEFSIIMEGIQFNLNAKKPRANSASKSTKQILAAVEIIESMCIKQGVRFSKDYVPEC